MSVRRPPIANEEFCDYHPETGVGKVSTRRIIDPTRGIYRRGRQPSTRDQSPYIRFLSFVHKRIVSHLP